MNYEEFEKELNALVKQNNLIEDCYKDVVKDYSGFIHNRPFVNFLKITDNKHIVETVNYFINVKHFLDENLDIDALKAIDKWYDLFSLIEIWRYDTTFFLLNNNVDGQELRKSFSKSYLDEAKVHLVYDELLTRYYAYKENTSEPIRCFTDLYGEEYNLYVNAHASPLDGDALDYFLPGINGKNFLRL